MIGGRVELVHWDRRVGFIDIGLVDDDGELKVIRVGSKMGDFSPELRDSHSLSPVKSPQTCCVIVGRLPFTPEGEREYHRGLSEWLLQGVFLHRDRERARALAEEACADWTYFLYEVQPNTALPREAEMPPGAYFPKGHERPPQIGTGPPVRVT